MALLCFFIRRSYTMQEIPISKFKATCLAVLEKVKQSGQPVLVTRFGKPVATIMPPTVTQRAPRFGTGIGSAEILGDIVSSISDESDWEAAQSLEPDK
jgi:prevent-host-death family protein